MRENENIKNEFERIPHIPRWKIEKGTFNRPDLPPILEPPEIISPVGTTLQIYCCPQPCYNNPSCQLINFSWSSVNGANFYEIQISDRNDFLQITPPYGVPSCLISKIVRGTEISLDLAKECCSIIYKKQIFWRVRYKSGEFYSKWSEVGSFNLETHFCTGCGFNVEDPCKTGDETCGSCQKSCQSFQCGNCESNCQTGECYTCQNSCESCQSLCMMTEGCSGCDTCDICETCDINQGCRTCDSCDNCQSCDSCQSCETSENCNKCDTCDICQSCDTCQTCDINQGCLRCDTCDTCERCDVCDTSEGCNIVCDISCEGPCLICQTDTCSNCQSYCQSSCENCELGCLTCQSPCQTGCEVCQVICERCEGCDVVCENSCDVSCEKVCQENCEFNCEDRCEKQCERTCESVCQIGCEVSFQCDEGCPGACEFYCQNPCQVQCELCEGNACEFGCQDECEVSCQGCEKSCQVSCQVNCQNTCERTCESSCDVSCEHCQGCEDNCEVLVQEHCAYPIGIGNPELKCGNVCHNLPTVGCDAYNFLYKRYRVYAVRTDLGEPHCPQGLPSTIEGEVVYQGCFPSGGCGYVYYEGQSNAGSLSLFEGHCSEVSLRNAWWLIIGVQIGEVVFGFLLSKWCDGTCTPTGTYDCPGPESNRCYIAWVL